VFVLLMALPALPLPTGGATHVLEIVTMLVALQLLVGRRCFWLPARWQRLQLAGPSRQKLLNALLRRIRWLERFSRPRATSLFDHRATTSAFGLLVFALTLSAFLAPPFSGLDTLPSLGVVVIGLGVLNRDIVLALAGAGIGAVGVATVLALETSSSRRRSMCFDALRRCGRRVEGPSRRGSRAAGTRPNGSTVPVLSVSG
jgi:hypothetical protein